MQSMEKPKKKLNKMKIMKKRNTSTSDKTTPTQHTYTKQTPIQTHTHTQD